MSAPPRNAWQAEPGHELERELIALCAQATAESQRPPRPEMFGRMIQDAANARSRTHTVIAVFACAAAFGAGIWASSRPPTLAADHHRQAALPSSVAAAPTPIAISRELTWSSSSLADESDAQSWNLLEVAGVGRIEVAGIGARELRELPSERQLALESGVLRAQISRQDPARPIVVVTPKLQVVVVGTRFDVFVEPLLTRVAVIEGHVRVHAGPRWVELSGGEEIRSDDPRLAAPEPPAPLFKAPVSPPAPSRVTRPHAAFAVNEAAPAATRRTLDDCDHYESSIARVDCLRELASGNSLEAQQALLAIGAIARDTTGQRARAIEAWREYETRFPSGAFGPEVELNLFETLLLEDRVEEALAVAAKFEQRFPSDPRTPRIAVARARILCGKAGQRSLGRQVLDLWSSTADPKLKSEIDLVRSRCEGPSFGPAGPEGLVPRDVLQGTSPPGD